jgi:hypothetical protein
MKNKFLLSIIFFYIAITFQSCWQTSTETVEYALRIKRFSPDTIIIDKKTSLDILISRLEKPWEFVNTMAGYWIGYTDDMFQIAYHKKKAIEPLLELIESSDSLRAKIAALYTLHLIGINSTVVGRIAENFSDTTARKAILSLLNDNQLNRDVLLLLKRDPWPMDIPFFMEYLAQSGNDYSYVLSALRNYLVTLKIENRPLFENLPQEIYNKEVTIKTDSLSSFHPIADLIGLKNALGNKIEIDKEILDSKEWKEGLKAFRKAKGEDLIHKIYLENGTETHTKPKISDIESFGLNPAIDYSGWKDLRFYYSFHDNKLFIYSQNNARIILLKWWESLLSEDKDKILRKKSLFESLK